MRSLKFYLASRFSRREELRGYMKDIESRGHEVTSRWLRANHESSGHSDADNARFATEDVEDILAADVFVHFTEEPLYFNLPPWKPLKASPPGCGVWTASTGGRHREAGIVLGARYAAGQYRRFFIVGPPENVFDFLPAVDEVFPTWEEFLQHLDLVDRAASAHYYAKTPVGKHPWRRHQLEPAYIYSPGRIQ